MSLQALEDLVTDVLMQAAGSGITVETVQLNSLSPGRPAPTHRFDHVV